MIWLPKFDDAQVLRGLADATVMMGVPTFYTRLLANPDFTQERAAHMRLFVCGSAPCCPRPSPNSRGGPATPSLNATA